MKGQARLQGHRVYCQQAATLSSRISVGAVAGMGMAATTRLAKPRASTGAQPCRQLQSKFKFIAQVETAIAPATWCRARSVALAGLLMWQHEVRGHCS